MVGGHTASALARAAMTAAADAGAEHYDVAGLCLGSPVALAVQRARPAATGRIILHTPLVAPWLVRRWFQFQMGFMLAAPVYPGIVWLGHRRVVSDLYKRFMVEGKDVDPTAAQANFDNQLRANPRAAREWLRDALRRDDLAQVRGAGSPCSSSWRSTTASSTCAGSRERSPMHPTCLSGSSVRPAMRGARSCHAASAR